MSIPALPADVVQAVDQARAAAVAKSAVWSRLADQGSDLAVNLAVAGVILVATLLIARWAAQAIQRALERLQARHNTDPTLRIFIASVARYAIVSVGLVAVLQQLGVKTTSILAAVGAASLAIGLAMQGALSNVAAGVMILIFRPFRVGDIIDSAGRTGRVRTLDLFVTELATLDNLKVVIPNSKVFGDVITNHSFHDRRRADAVFRTPLTADIPAMLTRLRTRLESSPRVLRTPAPVLEVTGMADTWVEIAVRPWAARDDYALVKADILLCARLLEADPNADLPPPPPEASSPIEANTADQPIQHLPHLRARKRAKPQPRSSVGG